jgi:hypothetical protein
MVRRPILPQPLIAILFFFIGYRSAEFKKEFQKCPPILIIYVRNPPVFFAPVSCIGNFLAGSIVAALNCPKHRFARPD